MEESRLKKLIIIGASGHGKVVADIAKMNGYEEIVFLDDDTSIKLCSGYPVMGSVKILHELEGDVFVAIGNAVVRKSIIESEPGLNFPVLIHPGAIVAADVSIGAGSVVMAGAVINPGAKLGIGAIVNTSSSVDHDCDISDYCHIAVGAHLCGTVTLGEGCWVGAGATVSNNINICSGCTIGAGAVVIKNIDVSGTYVGVPARLMKEK